MRSVRSLFVLLCLLSTCGLVAIAQTSSNPVPSNQTMVITPATTDISVGQKVQFNVVVKDAKGNVVKTPPVIWTAAPFDLAVADESGMVSFFNPGEVLIAAIVGGKPGFVTVKVKPTPVTRVDIEPPKAPLVVGTTTRFEAVARSSEGNPRNDAPLNWSSNNVEVATVDPAGVVVGISPGEAQITATSGSAKGNVAVTVVKSNLTGLSIDPRSTTARTGDVVQMNVRARSGQADNHAVRWTLSGPAERIVSCSFVLFRGSFFMSGQTNGSTKSHESARMGEKCAGNRITASCFSQPKFINQSV
jgi:hypothetical protein